MNSITSRVARLHTVCCTITIPMNIPLKHVMIAGTTDIYRRRILRWGVVVVVLGTPWFNMFARW